jgi:hypothetical protein
MGFPIKTCAICGEEFELRPDKPGFANRCWDCSANDEAETATSVEGEGFQGKAATEVNAARRQAIRELLYRKDS